MTEDLVRPAMSKEFTTENALFKCRQYIMAPASMTDPDFRRVRLRDEVAVDPHLVESTKSRLLDAGALWLRVSTDADGDVIIEGWKRR